MIDTHDTGRQKSALFTAIPLVGHVNPLLRQAQELARRGWLVAFAGVREIADHVRAEAPDVTFADLGPMGTVGDELRKHQHDASRDDDFVRGSLTIVRGLTRVWPVMFDGLTREISRSRPDLMVADLFTAAGACAADHARVPYVLNNPDLLPAISVRVLPPADHLPPLFSGKSIRDVSPLFRLGAPVLRRVAATAASMTIGEDLNAARRTRGLPAVDVHERQRDRLILVNGAFGVEYERTLPPRVHMVGPMLPREHSALPAELNQWITDGPPVVYANLGTIAVPSDALLATMHDAFSSQRFRVLWIAKGEHASRMPRNRSANVRVMEWGPPLSSVLHHPNVRAFVSHCGINSAYESLAAGVPIVGIPMFADQLDMAVRVADAGAGVWCDRRKMEASELRRAIHRVLDEQSFRARMPSIQAAIAKTGGAKRAAELIEQQVC